MQKEGVAFPPSLCTPGATLRVPPVKTTPRPPLLSRWFRVANRVLVFRSVLLEYGGRLRMLVLDRVIEWRFVFRVLDPGVGTTLDEESRQLGLAGGGR